MCWLSGEPTIDEMLLDPTVITMMKRDGVEPDDVWSLIRDVSSRLRRHARSTIQSAERPSAPRWHGAFGAVAELLSDEAGLPHRSERPLQKRARFAGGR